MIPIGLGIVWAGYTLGVWGYCLIRGYDVPFTALFHTTWPGGSTAGKAKAPAAPAGSSSPASGNPTAPGTAAQPPLLSPGGKEPL